MKTINSNIKVLFVHGNSNIIAGQELSLLSRIKGLGEKGIRTLVVVNGDGIFFTLLKQHNIETKNLTLNRIRKKNPFPFVKTVFQIYRLIRKERISIVHCSGVYPNQYCLPAARLAGIPCVVHVNSTIYSKEDFLKSFLQYADTIIAVSEAAKNRVINFTGINKEEKTVSYNGIKIRRVFDAVELGYGGSKNLNNPNNESKRQRLNIGDNVKVVGQIGQIIPRKGLEYFIKMARIVKDAFPKVKFLVVGSAPPESLEYELKQKRLVANSGLNEDVIFTGFQSDVSSFIEILDVSVLASLEEGFGRVIIESMALAKPIVGTSVGGIPEIITDKQTGLLVPPQDPDALAKAVLMLLENPTEAKRLGNNGSKFVFEKFTLEKHTEEVLKIYNSLLN